VPGLDPLIAAATPPSDGEVGLQATGE